MRREMRTALSAVLLAGTVNAVAGSIVEWRQALVDADVPRVLVLWGNAAGQPDRDDNGATMLHRALHVYSARRVDVVRALLAAGAPVDARVEDGATPLFSASPAAAALLIKAGADPLARNRLGEVPLHHNRQAAFLGAGVDVRDNAGLTPLHHAALTGDDSAVAWLLERGVDTKARTLRDTHLRTTSMSKAFGPGERVPAGSRPYDLALAQYKRTRFNTSAHEAAMKRLDAVTPCHSFFSR